MIGIISFVFLNVVSKMSADEIPNVSDYFDGLRGDMTKLSWAHAVNNQTLLKKALSDGTVMMLEADIVLGRVIGTNQVVPIMAHPPATESDLSLRHFLDEVVKAQKTVKKGIKLDFKSIEAFVKSLDVINAVRNELKFPLWLNADILKGPIESQTAPVDADQFLNRSAEAFPTSTLSLGWTTRYDPFITGNYTDQQLNEMKEAIIRNNVIQPVTLAVRAGIVAETAIAIKTLVENIDSFQTSNKTTLTIWMSTETDPVDIEKLKNLILSMGKSRTFLDVPEAIRSQLNLNSSAGKSTPIAGAVGAFVAVLTSVSALFTNAFNLFD